MQGRRRRFVGWLMGTLVLLGAGAAAQASPDAPGKVGSAKSKAGKSKIAQKSKPLSRQAEKAASKKAKARLATRKLHDLDWHAGWKQAVTTNLREPTKARPIFFLRILGDLAGGT